MSAAGLKKPAGSAGYEKEAIYTKNNISQNQHAVNQAIVKTRTSLHLSLDEWHNFSVFCARLALDHAPPEIRQLFLGKPSETPRNTLLLAEIFTTLVMRAEDAAEATNATYSYADLWEQALSLWGGAK